MPASVRSPSPFIHTDGLPADNLPILFLVPSFESAASPYLPVLPQAGPPQANKRSARRFNAGLIASAMEKLADWWSQQPGPPDRTAATLGRLPRGDHADPPERWPHDYFSCRGQPHPRDEDLTRLTASVTVTL